MRLIDNKEGTMIHKIYDNIYWKEWNIHQYVIDLRFSQSMDIQSLINSDYLIDGIYHDIDI